MSSGANLSSAMIGLGVQSAHMHVVGVDEFVYKCRAAAAAGAVNEGGDAGRAMRRAQLAGLTGGKDCVFVDTGGSIDAAAAAVESALVTLAPALGFSPTADVQVLTPGNKGPLGAKELNQKLRPLLNPRCADLDCLLPPNSEHSLSLWLTIAARAYNRVRQMHSYGSDHVSRKHRLHGAQRR